MKKRLGPLLGVDLKGQRNLPISSSPFLRERLWGLPLECALQGCSGHYVSGGGGRTWHWCVFSATRCSFPISLHPQVSGKKRVSPLRFRWNLWMRLLFSWNTQMKYSVCTAGALKVTILKEFFLKKSRSFGENGYLKRKITQEAEREWFWMFALMWSLNRQSVIFFLLLWLLSCLLVCYFRILRTLNSAFFFLWETQIFSVVKMRSALVLEHCPVIRASIFDSWKQVLVRRPRTGWK